MEWLSVILWALVAGLAAPIGAGATMGAPSLGLGPLAGVGGLVLCVLFMIFGGNALAWCAFGLAVLGAIVVWLGAWRLIDEHRPVSWAHGVGEETIALLCGAAAPLFVVEAGVALLVALDYSNVT
jgi:hypothetical protein